MPGGLPEPVVLDATVLSNFASSGAVGWLVELLDSPAVPPAVEAEIKGGREHGHGFLDDAAGAIGDGIPVLEVEGGMEAAATTDIDATLARERRRRCASLSDVTGCSRRMISPRAT